MWDRKPVNGTIRHAPRQPDTPVGWPGSRRNRRRRSPRRRRLVASSRLAELADNAVVGHPLDADIDALYALPLSEFVAARQALTRTLKGDEARLVKALAKPTTVPWVVNQIRWHDRALYDRVLKAGASLRAAQIGALEGRATKLADAAATHKHALSAAVQAGMGRAAAAGVSADADGLTRMLENVSLTEQPPEPHGRFTKVVQPAGFEALLGVALKPTPAALRVVDPKTPASKTGKAVAPGPADLQAQQRLERERAEAADRRNRAIADAEARLAAARQHEAGTREAWHQAKDAVEAAERDLFAARRSN